MPELPQIATKPASSFISQLFPPHMFLKTLTQTRYVFRLTARQISINHPSPLPLPREDQREFEDLLRKAQTPLAPSQDPQQDLAVHPDARQPITPEFEGDVNPTTGEKGGPKREPVIRWAADPGGDWSFKGRVSDF